MSYVCNHFNNWTKLSWIWSKKITKKWCTKLHKKKSKRPSPVLSKCSLRSWERKRLQGISERYLEGGWLLCNELLNLMKKKGKKKDGILYRAGNTYMRLYTTKRYQETKYKLYSNILTAFRYVVSNYKSNRHKTLHMVLVIFYWTT